MNPWQKYDLYSAAFRVQAHDVFATMRSNDPVYQQPGLDGKTLIWFVTRFDDVEKVLLDSRTFVRDPALISDELAEKYGPPDNDVAAMMSNHMLNKDGDTHRRLRSLVGKAFTPKVIADLRPRIEEIAEELLEAVEPQGRMELISQYAFPLPITVIAELLGIPVDRQEQFRIWSNAFVTPALTEEEQAESARLLTAFAGYMLQLVVERRGQPGDDLLSGLIHVEEQGDVLSENELFSMLTLLIVAGHETTVSLIGNATLALLRHPDSRRQLREDPSLIPDAVEEFLRYDSPVERALARWVARDVELGGQQLRRGELLIAVIGSANRDHERFSDPTALDIGRRPNPHLAFGKGAHYCLGAPLARLEGAIALRSLIQRFPHLQLDVDPGDLTWRDAPTFRSLEKLPVRW